MPFRYVKKKLRILSISEGEKRFEIESHSNGKY